MDASLFSIELVWMREVKTYLEIGQMPETVNLVQKQKLARKVEPFILKEGIMYKVGQNNKMCRSFETQIVLKELHEGVVSGHFVANIIIKKKASRCKILVSKS
jgi:hypothetical protein